MDKICVRKGKNSPLNRSLSRNSSTKTSVRFLPWPPKIDENRDSVDSFRFGFLRSLVPSFLPVPFFVTFSSSDVELLSHAFFATGFAFSSYKNTISKNCPKVNTKKARLQKSQISEQKFSKFQTQVNKKVGLNYKLLSQTRILVILLTTLFWWLYDGDNFTIKILWCWWHNKNLGDLFSICWWSLHSAKLFTNIFSRSPTSITNIGATLIRMYCI